MTAASMQRQARGLVHGLAAQWSGRGERGPDRKVRRNSYDEDDGRARVFRPIGDGTVAGALRWIDCVLDTIEEWDDLERRRGGARPLGLHGLKVLKALLGRSKHARVPIDFKTGRLDPAIDTIAAAARVGRSTVIRALANLKRLGVLDWVRRTRVTDNAGGYGPQREQISNAYFFCLRLPERVLQRFRDVYARRKLAAKGAAPPDTPPTAPAAGVIDPELRAALQRIEASIPPDDASPPSGEYPASGIKG